MAFIVKNPYAEIREEEIVKLCKENLASYKCVKEIYFINPVPKNAPGKVLKRELRQQMT